TNSAATPRAAELHADFAWFTEPPLKASGQKILDRSGALVLVHSDPNATFDEKKQRLSHRFQLQPGGRAAVYFKMPYLPDSAGRTQPIDEQRFNSAHREIHKFWSDLLARGMKINVPEARVNDVWRALLLQNFVLADGPRMTYGSGFWYNTGYYP